MTLPSVVFFQFVDNITNRSLSL